VSANQSLILERDKRRYRGSRQRPDLSQRRDGFLEATLPPEDVPHALGDVAIARPCLPRRRELCERPIVVEVTPVVEVTKRGAHFRAVRLQGDGPVDALMKAIDAAIGTTGVLLEYSVGAVTSGKDALGEARVVCEIDGRTYTGLGVSTDVLEASAIAYIRAVNASRKVEEGERVAGGV